MLLHAALSDPGPYGERTRALALKLQKFFSQPRNKGRVINQRTIQKHVGATDDEMSALKVFVAQTWTQLNQDAPTDAKVYYKAMLDDEMAKLDPDVRILISRTIEDFPRQAFVTKERGQTITRTVTAAYSKEFVKTYEKREVAVTAAASPLEEAIARVRDAYITAPVGDIPAVTELMVKFKLLDAYGKPAPGAPPGISEALVRERQLAEDWRGQRGKHVVRAFDIIPEEVKLIAIMRAVEAHRILFSHMKAISHIYTQYYKTGVMPSLDPGGKALKLRADPSILASLAETMRRMLEGSGEKVSITLNNTTAAQQAVQAEGAKADVQISQATKEYLARMSTMPDAEIEAELRNMDQLRLLLANGGVTGEEATTQTIDVPASPQIPLDKPQGV